MTIKEGGIREGHLQSSWWIDAIDEPLTIDKKEVVESRMRLYVHRWSSVVVSFADHTQS